MKWLPRAFRVNLGCPPGWKLTRAVSEGIGDPEVTQHLRDCARCAMEVEGLRKLSAVAPGFPKPGEMSDESRRAISARLLGVAPGPARRAKSRAALILVGAVGAAAVVVLLVGRTPRHAAVTTGAKDPAVAMTRSRASIRAIGAARFARIQEPPDDVVQLEEGTIVLEVSPIPHGERFRVRTTDAEVEVRGTRFQVSAAGGGLLAVSVAQGRVEVRSPGGGHVVLEPGDEWVRGAPINAGPPIGPSAVVGVHAPFGTPDISAPTGVQASSPPSIGPIAEDSIQRRRPPPVEPSAKQPAPAAQASFDRAWSLLRRDEPKRAAALFAEVERFGQGSGIAEDALYWRAVAIARAGDAPEAKRLFGEFLARFPRSSRGGEAATALGWLLLADGDSGAARRAFEQATGDLSPTVRASASDGLRRATQP